jgi:MYXO-CTERM domain-containing protein
MSGAGGATMSGATTSTTSGTSSTSTGLPPKPTEEGGCSCRVGANDNGSSRGFSAFAALAIGLVLAKRRRLHRY